MACHAFARVPNSRTANSLPQDDAIYLVLADVTVSNDGGHLAIRHEQFWVRAAHKQKAASICANHCKTTDEIPEEVMAVKVVRVVAIEQWGKDYFPVINAQ